MKTISYKLKDLDQKEKKVTLKLGYVGENEHVQIRIDCAEIWKDYPAAVASLAVEPPEGEKYPAIVTREGNVVCWTVKDSDLVNDGYGRIQLTFTEGSEIQKTVICRTKVDESIVGSGTAPDPIAGFVAEANEALAELEAAEVHGPVIGEDGYWYTWSKDAGEYVKTDTKAQGEDGQQGPPGKDGADGAPGQDGHTPVKGTDYWTQQDQADIVAAAALETVSAVIDDTAGDGDTNKTWSADKISETTGQLLTAIQGVSGDVLSLAGIDIVWEVGTIGGADGQDASSPNRLRVKGYIPISIFIKATQHGNGSFKYFAYDSSFTYLGTADWTQTYLASVTKSEVTTAYPTAKYVRILWRWTNEASTSLSDVQRADLRIEQDTYKASVDASISDIDDKIKKKCGLITNSGRVFTADMLTITGTNTTVKDDNSKVFAKTAKRITASADGATVKLSLGGDYAFDTVTVVFYLPYDSYKGDSPTALDLRIYANATTNTPIVSASNCCWGWNFLKIPRNKMGLGQSLVISSIDMVFKKTSDTTETNFGEIVVDSIIIDMEMKPTFILDFDQIWEESIENGAYEYCRTNNIPYTIHTYQYANLNAAKQAEMKKAMLNGCEFSYYGAFTSANELKNATSYSDALAECVLMENDIIPVTSKRFITYGCGAHIMNRPLRESLEASGVKAIRGRWTQNPVGYFCDRSTWLPYTIEISYANSSRSDFTDHIYEAVVHGSCVVAFTHGICDDDESTLGTSSSAMRISDFKYMIDYLVSLRNQGKIQICTMEQFVNQCLG